MNKKQTIKKTAALVLGLALAMGTTSCGFITKDNQKDYDQTIAEIQIEKAFAENDAYASIKEDFEKFNFAGDVKKRELVSYYVSVGYQYVQNYGYSKKDTFNMLLTALVNREILAQEAAAYFMKNNSSLTSEGYETFKTAELANVTAEEKALLEKYEDVLKFKYFLMKGTTDTKEYDIAEYTLKKNINTAIDKLEESYIKAESDSHTHEAARTLPTGVDTEVEDYYVAEGYEVYTGRNAAGAIVGYEKLEGSTVATRQKAYNAFLTNLQSYDLVSTTGKVENTAKITSLEYYYVELGSLLEQRLINLYYEGLQEEINDELTEEYVQGKYVELYEKNKRDYEKDATAFASALDSVSETSFLLYAPLDQDAEGNDMTFGYVYNILLPFSTSQNVAYTEAKSMGLQENTLYAMRREIGRQIEGKDLRNTWISKHDHANHSYEKDGKYYFFEENNGEKYEELTKYLGNYAFNGTVEEVEGEDDYKITAKKVSIDEFITTEFEGYINKVLEGTGATANGAKVAAYETTNIYKTNAEGKEEIDYANFTYYAGKVNFSETQKAAGFFDETTQQYKALSAVNELMFAYSTDTGCLNTTMGYSVSPYGTNFVKEFEKAAQDVVKAGVGNYAVCLTDYGWHIVYCSFSFNANYMGANNEVFGVYNHAEATDETETGSFSELFYEYVKSSAYTGYTTEKQNQALKKYDNDNCVNLHKDRYEDLYTFGE